MKLGPKADGLNSDETEGLPAGALGGVTPNPIRKRGYHRALKRNAPWALHQRATYEMINDISKHLYGPLLNSEIFDDNKLFGLSAWLPKNNYIVPINYFGLDRTALSLRPKIKVTLWERIKWRLGWK